MTKQKILIVLLTILSVNSARAMVFDNRFFPLIQHPYLTVPDHYSHMMIDGFATTGDKATDDRQSDTGIPEIFGPFNQAQMAQEMILVGFENPLRPVWLVAELPWSMEGKIQSQGISFFWQQHLHDWLSAGIYMALMRVESSQQFFFQDKQTTALLGPGDVLEIERDRREMFSQLCLDCNHWSKTGWGDMDIYLRASHWWDHAYKFRTIIAGARLGMLVPTGVERDIFNPASVPFGGNGHWGLYGSVDGEFEIREDWKVGLMGRVSKRFAKTVCERLPLCTNFSNNKEQKCLQLSELFVPLVGHVRINPGVTGVFLSYFSAENLRDGFGVRLQYTLIDHQQDSWEDQREDQSLPINFNQVQERSSWASEYLSVGAFYDFGKMKRCRGHEPIVNMVWDIPVSLLVAHRFVKSFKVLLGVELNW